LSKIGWPSVRPPPVDSRVKKLNCRTVRNASRLASHSVPKSQGSVKRSWPNCRMPDDLELEAQALAVAEEVVLLDLPREDEALDGAEAGPDLEGARGPLAHLDGDHDPVGLTPFLLGDLDPLEVPEGLDAPLALLRLRLAVELALDELDLAADHRVAGLGVAPDLDPFDEDRRATPDHDGDVDDPPLHVEVRLWLDLHLGVALVAVAPGDPDEALGDLRAVEPVAGLQGEPLPEAASPAEGLDLLVVAVELAHRQAADAKARPLLEGHRDVDVGPVRRQLDARRAHPHRQVALVEVVGGEAGGVLLEGLAVEAVVVGDEAEEARRPGLHDPGEIVRRDVPVAHEADPSDGDPLALVDGEDDADLVVVHAVEAVVDAGEEEALIGVLVADRSELTLERPDPEDAALLEVDLLREVRVLDLVVALEDDAPDGRPLAQVEAQVDALAALDRLDADVVEEAGVPERPGVPGHQAAPAHLPRPEANGGQDVVVGHPSVAVDADAPDAAAVAKGRGLHGGHRLGRVGGGLVGLPVLFLRVPVVALEVVALEVGALVGRGLRVLLVPVVALETLDVVPAVLSDRRRGHQQGEEEGEEALHVATGSGDRSGRGRDSGGADPGQGRPHSPSSLAETGAFDGMTAPRSSASTRPSRIITRRGMRPARSRLWVTMRKVVPFSALRSTNRRWMDSPVALSRLPVGSSARTILGFITRARARATRCCSPPDSSPGRWSRRCPRPTISSSSLASFSSGAPRRPWIIPGIITFSTAVNSGRRWWNWNTKPMLRFRNSARRPAE
jgi:hypothetical protein